MLPTTILDHFDATMPGSYRPMKSKHGAEQLSPAVAAATHTSATATNANAAATAAHSAAAHAAASTVPTTATPAAAVTAAVTPSVITAAVVSVIITAVIIIAAAAECPAYQAGDNTADDRFRNCVVTSILDLLDV